MSGMVKKVVQRGTKDGSRNVDTGAAATPTTSRLGRKMDQFSSIRARMKALHLPSRNDRDSGMKERKKHSISTAGTISDSDSDEDRRDVNNNNAKRSTRTVNFGDSVIINTSGSDFTSSTASDSDGDESLVDPTIRRVQFSNVSIRTYSLVLGETQASKTYPISLDWAHTPTTTLDISVFESVYASSNKKTPSRMLRGFRVPRRLRSVQRLELLTKVTGQKPEEIFESNLARISRENSYIPSTACCSDDGYVELRDTPYQMVDSDEYQQVSL